MAKQILTLDELYQFFVEQNQTTVFNAKDNGNPIVVTTNGFFQADESDMPGMLKLEFTTNIKEYVIYVYYSYNKAIDALKVKEAT